MIDKNGIEANGKNMETNQLGIYSLWFLPSLLLEIILVHKIPLDGVERG